MSAVLKYVSLYNTKGAPFFNEKKCFCVIKIRNVTLTVTWRKQFRVSGTKIGLSAEGASTLGESGGMVPREILKLSFSKMS